MLLAISLAGQAGAAQLPPARFVLAEEAGPEIEPLLTRVLDSAQLADPLDPEDDERLLRRLRDAALEALATEGYFEARIAVERDADQRARYALRVTLGPRAHVVAVDLRLRGGIEAQPARMRELRAEWELPVGAPFRDAVWSAAKTRLLSRIAERDFPAARLVDSQATVLADAAAVELMVEIDSGPAFTLGPLRIEGLQRYGPQLIERYNPFSVGDRYDAARLLEFQRRLQAAPYFSRVIVDVDPNAASPQEVPIRVEVTEAQSKRVSLGLGYSTNTGPRVEATYRQSLLFGFPYTLQGGVGVDSTRNVAYADVLLPPKPDGANDSLGGLLENTDVANVLTRRWALGVARTCTQDRGDVGYDTRITLGFQRELRRPKTGSDFEPRTNDVLSATYTWTRRAVDSITDPRRGDILTMRVGAGLSRSGIADTFVYSYGRYLRYFELGRDNQIILRGEAGHTLADDLSRVPNEFLFRAGGAGSVRGYGYQTLGAKTGAATLGSRSLIA
ncbi:MAG: BamA/TamA family outer membrane protein, partial [Burkholderiaceae bacterium]|nr:BamA/TamA family outer membrane protein [Burkholderiaceae bacterium]